MAASPLLQLIFFALALFSTSQGAHHAGAVDYWKSFYPDIPIPSLVSQYTSKMNSDNIDTVVSLIHKKTLSSNVPLFCKTSGLICSVDEIPNNLLEPTAGAYLCKNKRNYQIQLSHLMHKPSAMAVRKALRVFFRETTLKKGTKFNMGNIKEVATPAKAFLPDQIASLLNIDQSGALFQNTTVKDHIKMTIMMCNSHIPQEIKKCTSSVEELVKFSAEIFPDKRVKVLYPKSTGGERTTVLLENIRPILRNNLEAKFMVCHEAFFPYTIMYCHATSDVQVYKVDLVDPKTVKTINDGMVAVCHRNTSYWSPKHVSMIALGTRPGECSICHWMSTDAIAFVHLDDTLTG